jgi:DNA-binding XRE family transcriptional regulator
VAAILVGLRLSFLVGIALSALFCGFPARHLESGETQAELAGKAGVTEACISMLESETRKNPSLPALKKIAKALGVPVTALLE